VKRLKSLGIGALALAILVGIVLILTAQIPPGKLPGLVSADPFVKGCVECHKAQTGGTDLRLNVSLKQVARHPDITNIVRNIPTDCAICHKSGTAAKALNVVVHMSHYENRGDSVFVKTYGGDCLICHTLNTTTFAMTNKAAPKNW
jgi:hypothetical protein